MEEPENPKPEDIRQKGDGLGPMWKFWKRRRYYIAIMAFTGYVNSYATRANLSVAIVLMTSSQKRGNIVEKPEFSWDEETQGYILGSFFYGYIVTQILGGYLAGIMGGNHVINLGILGSGLLSFVTPPLAYVGPEAVIGVRVVSGLLQGLIIPAIHGVWARWAPPYETTILSGIAISGNFLSPIIVMPLCGVIGKGLGWPWTFHVFGITTVIWSVIWFFTVAAGPEKDRCITQGELKYIQDSIGERTDLRVKHPWLRIAISLPVWAIVMAQTGHNWGFYTILLYGPKYYNEALSYDLDMAGILTGVAFAILGILLQIFGPISDILRSRGYMTTVHVRKFFTCGGLLIQTFFMSLPIFITDKIFIAVALILAIGLGGITWAGFSVNHLDIAPPHAAILLGISNTFATIAGIVMPIIAGQTLPNDSKQQDYVLMWIICAGVYLGCGIFFLIFAQGEKQSWIFVPPKEETPEDGAPKPE